MLSSRRIILIGVVVLSVLNTASPSFAATMSEADYRREIRERFSLQCALTLQRRLGVANPMTASEILSRMESNLPLDVKMEEDRMLNVVWGKSTRFRDHTYREAVEACVYSGIAASRRNY